MSCSPTYRLTDAQWQHLARYSVAWDEQEERFAMLCDPGIVRAFRNPWHYSVELWKYWKAIRGRGMPANCAISSNEWRFSPPATF